MKKTPPFCLQLLFIPFVFFLLFFLSFISSLSSLFSSLSSPVVYPSLFTAIHTMTFSELWGELSQVKVKDAPAWVKTKATSGAFKRAANAAGEAYGRKYLLPGKGAPVMHVMVALGVFGYALEYSHLKGTMTARGRYSRGKRARGTKREREKER